MTPADVRVGSEVWVNGAWRRVLHVSHQNGSAAVVTVDLHGPYRYMATRKDRLR